MSDYYIKVDETALKVIDDKGKELKSKKYIQIYKTGLNLFHRIKNTYKVVLKVKYNKADSSEI